MAACFCMGPPGDCACQRRRRLSNDDIAMFDAALFASMTIVDEGFLIDDEETAPSLVIKTEAA